MNYIINHLGFCEAFHESVIYVMSPEKRDGEGLELLAWICVGILDMKTRFEIARKRFDGSGKEFV